MTQPTLPITVTVAEDDGDMLQPITNTGVTVNGVELRLTDMSGWDDTADVRTNPLDLPVGDGAYDDGPLMAARTIIVKGVALASTPAALLGVQRVFRRLLVRGNRVGYVAVTQGDGAAAESLKASVRLNGATTFQKTHPTRAEWSLSLYAADSRRYSTTERTGTTQAFVTSGGLAFPWTFPLTFGAGGGNAGQIIAVNDGDIPTGVRLSISGACTNPQIALVETGQRLALITSNSDGVVIDTNTRNRSVLRNGAPFAWVLTLDSEFFQLPVGTSTLLFLCDSGSPTLTAAWSDATP